MSRRRKTIILFNRWFGHVMTSVKNNQVNRWETT